MPSSNPNRLAVPSSPWGLLWLLHNNDGQALTDLGLSAWMQGRIGDANAAAERSQLGFTPYTTALPAVTTATGLGVFAKWPLKHVSDYGNDFDAAVATLGPGPYTLHIDADCICSANTVCGTGIQLLFEPDCQVIVNNGVTLRINSPDHVLCHPRQAAFTRVGTGAVRFTRTGTTYPGWFEAVEDGATDDAAAIQAAIDSLTASTWPGGVVEIGCHGIGSTIQLDHCHITLRGHGWGSITNGTGSVLHWVAGASTDPMLTLTNCEGAGVEDLWLMGNSASKPLAAIQLIQVLDGHQNAWNHFRNLWIGMAPWDAGHDYAEGLDRGILIGGAGSTTGNNCECKWDSIYVSGCRKGIEITSQQHQNHSWNNTNLYYCSIAGLDTAANMTMSNVYCMANAVDIAQTFMNAGPVVNIEMFTSENAGRMVYTDFDLALVINGGYWQANETYIHADNRFISCLNCLNQTITLINFALTQNGATPSIDTPMIAMRALAGGAIKTLRIIGNKSTSIDVPNLDMTPFGAPNNRAVIDVTDDGYYGAYLQDRWLNILGPGEAPDRTRYDLPAAKNLRIGGVPLERPLGFDWGNLQNGDPKTDIYTVPAGKSAIITRITVRDPDASLAGGTSFSFGSGANADSWKTAVDLSTMTAGSDYVVLNADATKHTVEAAGNVVGVKPLVGAVANARALIMVYGIEY